MEKKTLRKEMLRQRNELSAQEVKEWSQRICEAVIHSPQFETVDRMCCYFPLGNEVDIRGIIEAAWKAGKTTAFPKVFGNEMEFFRIESFDQLSEGSFHVMEPSEAFPVDWEEALILVPGVAFSSAGGRMGFGRGYYDKYLSRHPKYHTIGISYEFQLVEDLPLEAHDVPLQFLATEQGMKNTAVR